MKDYRRKRIQIISAVTLVLAGLMILSILWTTIRNTTHDKTYAKQQKEELVSRDSKKVLCGDIIDTNGTVIASAKKTGTGRKSSMKTRMPILCL